MSCADNLTNLTVYVDDGFKRKKDTSAVFLDVQGVFDNVDPGLLCEKIAAIGCSQKVVDLVHHLTCRRLIVSEFNSDVPRFTYKGVPLGVVLSPILYNIYISGVNKGISKFVLTSQFAYDIALIVTTRI